MNDIDPKLLNEAVQRIVQAMDPEQILLFGSRAWGHPTEDSDIDLLVVVETSNQPDYRRAREAYRSLRGLALPIEVVVRTQDEMARAAQWPDSLERQALERGRRLHG
jgi:uncharacterized protein